VTEINISHPSGLPYLELTGEGRKISFQRDCLGRITLFRTVDGQAEELLMENSRSPITDNQEFPPGSHIVYKIVLDLYHKTHEYELQVRL